MTLVGIFTLLVCVVVSAWLIKLDQQRAHANVRLWQDVARELGLRFSGDDTQRSMRGMLNGMPVLAEFERQRRQAGKTTIVEDKTRFAAGGNGRIPGSLTVRPDSLVRALGRLVSGSDESIGDGPFDDMVELPGLDAPACAALSSSARRQLRDLMNLGGVVKDGWVICEPEPRQTHDRAWLMEMLRLVSRLAAKLDVTSGSLPELLAHNAIHDPNPGVRLQNIRFLDDPATRTPPALLESTARALLSNAHAPLRLWAALQLEHEGTAVLVALASDPGLAAPLRIDALRALADRGAASELPALLTTLLSPTAREPGPPELASAALAIVAENRIDALAAAVAESARSARETVRAAALTALGQLEVPGAEATLTQALSDPSPDVQCAAAEALGLIGSVAAVEPLLPLARGLGKAPLRRAARAAIARIQSRLGDVEAGRLSLADSAELGGAVTLAEASEEKSGAVSLTEETESAPRGPKQRAGARSG